MTTKPLQVQGMCYNKPVSKQTGVSNMTYTAQVMIAVAAITVPFIATLIGAQLYVWFKGAENI